MANVRLQFIYELFAPRYIMPMIVFICQHCDEQQFRSTAMSTLHDFLSSKVKFMYASTVIGSHFCFEKTTRTPRVHLVIFGKVFLKFGHIVNIYI